MKHLKGYKFTRKKCVKEKGGVTIENCGSQGVRNRWDLGGIPGQLSVTSACGGTFLQVIASKHRVIRSNSSSGVAYFLGRNFPDRSRTRSRFTVPDIRRLGGLMPNTRPIVSGIWPIAFARPRGKDAVQNGSSKVDERPTRLRHRVARNRSHSCQEVGDRCFPISRPGCATWASDARGTFINLPPRLLNSSPGHEGEFYFFVPVPERKLLPKLE